MSQHPLPAILATMTPEERAAFDAINRAIAAGVVTPAERRTLAQRAKRGGVAFDRWVAGLGVRVAQSLTVQSNH